MQEGVWGIPWHFDGDEQMKKVLKKRENCVIIYKENNLKNKK